MRSLLPAPSSFIDTTTGAPAYGSYAGALPRVDLGRLRWGERIARRKRWVYVAIASDEIWISMAIVRAGYAATAFLFVFERANRRMVVDRTIVGPHVSARVADSMDTQGPLARFRLGLTRIELARRGDVVDVFARVGRLGNVKLEASIDVADAPPAIAAVAGLGEGLVNATEKRALAPVRGGLSFEGRRFPLDGAVGGYDYTYGLLPRHTRWRWAFAMGRAEGGAPIGFNVVEGFVGAAECAAFYDGRVHPLAEPRFVFDEARPEDAWRLEGEGIDLSFEPGAVYSHHTRLVVVRSRFVQPVGTFRGTLRLDGKDVRVADLPGVVEDQDVLW